MMMVMTLITQYLTFWSGSNHIEGGGAVILNIPPAHNSIINECNILHTYKYVQNSPSSLQQIRTRFDALFSISKRILQLQQQGVK